MRKLAFVLGLTSCTSLATQPQLESSPVKQCQWGRMEAGVHVVRSAAEWSTLTGNAAHGFGSLDWRRDNLLVFNAGQRPTPGYQLKLMRVEGSERAARWQLVVDEVPPPADAMLPQVISWPCLILRASQRAPDALEVVDSRGKVLAQLRQR
ncbi:protease complex subunit PrcB family protein [Viridibacterium curvum]|uniref:PrcB C-terminal domain-containing protein n=1 Tax=Viridibacterium curvum TaxID=1101404 RepID=A0ABP9QQZ0_9RHOO